MVDVIVIGAGVSGCAIARELSRYDASVCVLEKCEDVCEGTSKANSAIVHAGFDADEGSLMAKLNVNLPARPLPTGCSLAAVILHLVVCLEVEEGVGGEGDEEEVAKFFGLVLILEFIITLE